MKKKVCLITGGAGFLGKKYCEMFLKQKYIVICVDKNIKLLNKLNKKNRNLFLENVDITNIKEVKQLYIRLKKKFKIDVLINNAAIDAVPRRKTANLNRYPNLEDWDKEFNVSLKGSFLMIQFFGEAMFRRKKGSIINIGSDLSVIAPNQKIYRSSYKNYIKPVTYSVIKHGMLGLTKYYASLYASNNVRVNLLSPGPIHNKQRNKLVLELKSVIPMNRLGKTNDITGALYFLASEESSYITGQNIVVDGGRTII